MSPAINRKINQTLENIENELVKIRLILVSSKKTSSKPEKTLKKELQKLEQNIDPNIKKIKNDLLGTYQSHL